MTYKQIKFDQSEVLMEFEKLAHNLLISEAVLVDEEIPKISDPRVGQAAKEIKDTATSKFEKHFETHDWNWLDYLLEGLIAIPTPIGNPLSAAAAAVNWNQGDYLSFFFNVLIAFPAETGIPAAGESGKIAKLLIYLKNSKNLFLRLLVPFPWITQKLINIIKAIRQADKKSAIINFLITSGLSKFPGDYLRERHKYSQEMQKKYDAVVKEINQKCDIAERAIDKDLDLMCMDLEQQKILLSQ